MSDQFIYFLILERVIALTLALGLRHLGYNTAIPLIVAGALISLSPQFPNIPANPELMLIVLLTPLVFGEAMNSSLIDLRRVHHPILALAVLLVIVTTVSVGWTVSAMTDLPVALAFAMGAVLAPTDAVAISAVARKIAVPRSVVLILEGESMVNDGTGLTALHIALIALLVGSMSLKQVAGIFANSILGGIAIGFAAGWLLAKILEKSRDAVAANCLVLFTPFCIYWLAEYIHGSGILAVVIAGMYVAHRHYSRTGYTGRSQNRTIWKHMTFVLQTETFFVVGLETPDVLTRLTQEECWLVAQLVPAVLLTMIASRFVFVFGRRWVDHWFHPKREHMISQEGSLIIAWAGARGPVSGLAAFSIPVVFDNGAIIPGRDIFMATVFCVIFATLLLAQTIEPLARWLRTTADDDSANIAEAERIMANAALSSLAEAEEKHLNEGRQLPDMWLQHLRMQLDERLHSESPDTNRDDDGASLSRQDLDKIVLAMIKAEKKALIQLRNTGEISDAQSRKLMHRMDSREQSVRSHHN
ncbi:MAG: hypothetical protein RIQ52_1204 [Pseudomonadota bacterium]|jgi:CPA1 family monovalent cation:H+ antiporter